MAPKMKTVSIIRCRHCYGVQYPCNYMKDEGPERNFCGVDVYTCQYQILGTKRVKADEEILE
jgi:hypothetical protein